MHRLLVALVLFCVHPAAAQDAGERPRIGLALSGGGARGCAHVGVLRVLEELRVPVDFVAGTSMGAIVGGLYAAGYSADEVEELILNQDWDAVLNDRPTYRDLDFRRKEDRRRYLIGVELGLSKRGPWLPAGLSSGRRLSFLLRRYLQPVAHVDDFDRLPIPFRAVAANLATGDAVVLGDGALWTAIRASMSIPAVFTPVEVDDDEGESQVLVDGGFVLNLPVDVVREMGADIVIAVDISEQPEDPEQIDDLLSVVNQTFTTLIRQNVEQQIANADLTLVPPVQDFGTLAFRQAPEIVRRGAEETRRRAADLQRYSVDEATWEARTGTERTVATQQTAAQPLAPIGPIHVEGLERVDERVVARRLRCRSGDTIDFADLKSELERIVAMDVFETVRFDLVAGDGQTNVTLHVAEKSWGPTFLHMGLRATTDLEGDSAFTGVINVTRMHLNAREGEWRNDLRVGRDRGVLTELYQPLDFAGRFFFAPRFEVRTETQPIYTAGQKVAEYRSTTIEAAIDVGARLGRNGEIRAGFLAGKGDAKVETGAVDLPSFDVDRNGLSLRLTSDSTDDEAIPQSGALVSSELFVSRQGLGSDLDYERLALRANVFLHSGRHTVFAGLEGGSDLGSDLPFFEQFRFGGLMSFGGYAEGELRAPRYAVGRLGYHFKAAELSGLLDGLYFGGVVEAGDLWQDGESVRFDDLLASVTLFVMADTLVGPFSIGYGVAEDGSDSFYFQLGRTF